MNRKSFIKNSLMSLAIAMLPKILRPVDVQDEYVRDYGEIIKLDLINSDEVMNFKISELPKEFHSVKISGHINDVPPKWAYYYVDKDDRWHILPIS